MGLPTSSARERLAPHTEEHLGDRSICDSDHEICANFIMEAFTMLDKLLAWVQNPSQQGDPPVSYIRPLG